MWIDLGNAPFLQETHIVKLTLSTMNAETTWGASEEPSPEIKNAKPVSSPGKRSPAGRAHSRPLTRNKHL